jgi:hypothetical protein
LENRGENGTPHRSLLHNLHCRFERAISAAGYIGSRHADTANVSMSAAVFSRA